MPDFETMYFELAAKVADAIELFTHFSFPNGFSLLLSFLPEKKEDVPPPFLFPVLPFLFPPFS